MITDNPPVDTEKTEYILRSLSKISSKRWEHYVINRCFHFLNDPEIEFVCQQCIRKADGKIALADLFFPQLGLYLEVDEGHHDSDAARISDAQRRLDIADVLGFSEYRITTSGRSLAAINADIDKLVNELRARKAAAPNFQAWDYLARFKPDLHLRRGSIKVGPDAAFQYQKDALSCFGYTGGHFQRGAWTVPDDTVKRLDLQGSCIVWFPRLDKHKDWDNSLSEDGKTITEIPVGASSYDRDTSDIRIVMARSTDELNRTLYRFVGVFAPEVPGSTARERRFTRIHDWVKTIPATNGA